MCNLSVGIEEKGSEKGKYMSTVSSVESLMEILNLSEDDACRALKITVKEYKEAKAILKDYSN